MSLGLNDCQIGRYLNVPFRTIQRWRRPDYVAKHPNLCRQDCPICNDASLNDESYAYLLGLYLGDGVLVRCHREVYRLEIALDSRYPGIIQSCEEATAAMRDRRLMKVNRVCYETWQVVYAYWKHWPCLFPQHGPGPKHARKIRLASWQERITAQHPGLLVRGLIHSDGWRGTNRVTNARGAVYEYPRYEFSNRSGDIRDLFCKACDTLEIGWTRTGSHKVAVSRRPDVAILDHLVGPKR